MPTQQRRFHLLYGSCYFISLENTILANLLDFSTQVNLGLL